MTRRVHSVLSALSAIAVGLVACSTNPGSDGGTTGGSSVTAACTDAASKLCNKLATCSPLLLQLLYSDSNGCNNAWNFTCQALANANGSPFTSDNIGTCGQASASASCGDAVNAILAGTLPGCDFHGSVAQGAACAASSQCAGANSYCQIPVGQLCGVCAMRAPANGQCTQTVDCQAGLTCNSMGTCVTPGASGAQCGNSSPCQSGLTCTQAKCAAWAEDANAKCDPSALLACDYTKGLFCNGSSVCAMVTVGTPGGMCGTSSTLSNYTVCPGAVFCPTPANSLMGTCPKIAADGSACDGNATICNPPSVCVNGTCSKYDPSSCH